MMKLNSAFNRVFSLAMATIVVVGAAYASTAYAEIDPYRIYRADKLPAGFQDPWGAAFDSDGNLYVADSHRHRIVKFGPDVNPIKTFGTAGAGKLFFPDGVAVGKYQGTTIVYVADTSNSRVVAFSDKGVFIRRFGISGDGKLNNPEGIAAAPGPNGDVFVADNRNARVVRFSATGQFKAALTCASCPDGTFSLNGPVGVAVRRLDVGIEIYVVDQYHGKVHVLSGDGSWIRDIGTPGTSSAADPGELYFPDDVAVADDGSAYVVESGTNRVSEFGPAGDFQFLFSTGTFGFNSPHGIAINASGKLLAVANTGADQVESFRITAGVIAGTSFGTRAQWKGGAYFQLYYHGVEGSCAVDGKATIVAHLVSGNRTFKISGHMKKLFYSGGQMRMDMTAGQRDLISKAWGEGKTISVSATFEGACPGDTTAKGIVNFTK